MKEVYIEEVMGNRNLGKNLNHTTDRSSFHRMAHLMKIIPQNVFVLPVNGVQSSSFPPQTVAQKKQAKNPQEHVCQQHILSYIGMKVNCPAQYPVHGDNLCLSGNIPYGKLHMCSASGCDMEHLGCKTVVYGGTTLCLKTGTGKVPNLCNVLANFLLQLRLFQK